MVENLVMERESKAWCCGHLRQRIKVLHPVMFSCMEACPFRHVLLEGTPEDASDMFNCMCECPMNAKKLRTSNHHLTSGVVITDRNSHIYHASNHCWLKFAREMADL